VIIDACILTPHGFVKGRLRHERGRIVAIDGDPVDEPTARSSGLPLALPGFVDLHVHGGGGHDTMDGGEALAKIAAKHAQHGTTALLATTVTSPPEALEAALRAMAPACDERPRGGARVLGIHLEGPYINPGKLGAQPDFARGASLDEVLKLHAIAPVRLVTVAPELPGHIELIVALRQRGFAVQIGHALHHRTPGIVGAALAHAERAEIIPDLLHVHPGAIRAALRAIPQLYCVTDSTAAAGMPDGEYRLGSHTVTKCLGGVRLADGTLAGSTLTMDEALRNLVLTVGLTVADASRRTSTFAADHLGLNDRGRLQIGAWADLVLLDRELRVQQVIVEGEMI
jgi:N-acetylglucosamine-6-phosphate deacetylase